MDETQYPEEAVECCEWNDVHKDGNDETPIAMERSKSLAKLGPSQVGDINLPKSSENVRKSMRMKRKLILEDYIYPLKSRKGCVVRKDGNDKIPIAVERSKSLAKLGPSQVSRLLLLEHM
ncbi:uncharacterized protein [Hetaerina americana]|uniref:uncharacterized protein n=1 Tax=Hetaerina americana TaxID=62018 RepID=UPI003A7F30B4